MTADQLVAVIDVCSKGGVTYLKTQEMELHFAGHVSAYQEKINAEQHQINDNTASTDGSEVEDDLLLTDPLAHEESLAKNEEPS